MAPPPRPPIICYDLQTSSCTRNSCARHRTASSGAPTRKSRVTVVRKDLGQPEPRIINDYYTRSSNDRPSILKPSNTARYDYDLKLRHASEERERRRELKRSQLARQGELDEISEKLKSFKRVQENLLKTFGMSHNVAKYIQKQDEEFVRLQRKVDEFAETRSRELGREVQRAKRFHELQKIHNKNLEHLRSDTIPANIQRPMTRAFNKSLSSSSSQETDDSGNTNPKSSSTTISISDCSSPLTLDEHQISKSNHSVHFLKSPSSESSGHHSMPRSPLQQKSTLMTTSTPTRKDNLPSDLYQGYSKEQFSFYKPPDQENTLEITATRFFEGIEDETMMDIHDQLNKMQLVINGKS